MRIPSHIKWITLICGVALLPLLLIGLPAFLVLADIMPWPSKPESHPTLYDRIGASPPPDGHVWSYGGASLADSLSYYRLPLGDALPATALQEAPLADTTQRARFARWWGTPQNGSRILTIEEHGTRYEMIWDPKAGTAFLSCSSAAPY